MMSRLFSTKNASKTRKIVNSPEAFLMANHCLLLTFSNDKIVSPEIQVQEHDIERHIEHDLEQPQTPNKYWSAIFLHTKLPLYNSSQNVAKWRLCGTRALRTRVEVRYL